MAKKRFLSTKKCTLSSEDAKNQIFADTRQLLEKKKFSKDEIALFLAQVNDVIMIYREKFGAEKEVEYLVRKRYRRIEVSIIVEGDKISPFDVPCVNSTRMLTEKALKPLLVNKIDQISHVYSIGRNFVTITSPQFQTSKIWKSPMLWSVILGLLFGFLCYRLPAGAKGLLIDDILNPIFKVAIGVITGIMGPVIFISMITSVSALQSINDLTDMGFKIIGRFLLSILAVMAVGIGFTLIFYHNFGVSGVDFEPRNLVELLLDIIPTDFISPLLNGNTPQLVVLGLLLGAALLVLGNKVDGLKDTLGQVNAWIMSAMGLVMTIVPIIPFISILSTVAKGDGATLLKGWEFIVASYAIAIICGAAKLIIVCTRFKLKLPVIWKKLWPMIATAFASANNSTMLKTEYDISENELGIKPEFSGLWIPMSQAMLNPRQTINMIIPPILILKYTNTPIFLIFLVVYVLLVLELSIANPGTTGAWTILFAALALPPEYVGTFMMYKLFTANFNAAYGALQVGLEQIEAANRFDAIDIDKLRG